MTLEQVIEIIERYKLRIPPTVYYELLADVQEAEEEQEPTTKNDLALLEKTYADFCSCEGGEGWLKIDGKEYSTDAGYALEGMSIFMEVFKQRLAELSSVTPQEPKTGHWIETAEEYYKAVNEKGGGVNEDTDYFTDDIACSECLAKFSVIDNEAERFDFCPCCGSDNK